MGTQLLVSQDVIWWTGVVWIICRLLWLFLSDVWFFIRCLVESTVMNEWNSFRPLREDTHTHSLLNDRKRKQGHGEKERETHVRTHNVPCAAPSEVIPDLKECMSMEQFSSEISSSTQLWLFIACVALEDHEEERNAPLPPPSYESALISSDWRITSTYEMLHLYL